MHTNLTKLQTKVAQRADILKYLEQVSQTRKQRVLAMYNSNMDMLISGADQDLMVFPIDDRLPNRAHGVMETGNVKNYRISALDFNLNRLFNSAKILGFEIPMSKEQIANKIHDLAHLAYSTLETEQYTDIANQVLVLKIYVSTGIGDFDIFGCNKQPIVYAAIYLQSPDAESYNKGVKEYIHPQMWTTPNYFSNAKTVNYLDLATMADYSKSRGGYLGIKVDPQGNLLEGAVSNIAFVLKDGTFAHPPLAKTIRGSTLSKALKIVDNHLIPDGMIKSIREIELSIDQLDQVQELFHLSNDHIVPILSVNDRQIGNGSVGVISQYLLERLEIARSEVKLDQGVLIQGLEV